MAIIGCGAAGLAALRHFTADGSAFTCVAYEQTDSVGGTWVYTDQVGMDKYGLPVHSSMYKSLRCAFKKLFKRRTCVCVWRRRYRWFHCLLYGVWICSQNEFA